MNAKTPNINKILRGENRSSASGSPMGAPNDVDTQDDTRVYLQRVRFVDGDYGADGTYWGGGRENPPLYCAFTFNGTGTPTRVYARGWDRTEAGRAIVKEYGLKIPGVHAE